MMRIEEVRSLIERQARAWERADAAAIVADFTPDGVLISPTGRWQGHQALRAAAEAAFAEVTDISITVTRVLLDGDQGAVEWTWSETNRHDGYRSTVEDGIIFELQDGKIVLWREYFDTAAMHAPPGQPS
jgi:uncharacterized protein (TIGR02246 family)